MAVVSEIFLERETANDEDGLVVAVHVDSGAAVKSGQPLFDVEHSKATMEICATVDGFVLHELTKGATVIFGSPTCRCRRYRPRRRSGRMPRHPKRRRFPNRRWRWRAWRTPRLALLAPASRDSLARRRNLPTNSG
jgi:hypothetical protein